MNKNEGVRQVITKVLFHHCYLGKDKDCFRVTPHPGDLSGGGAESESPAALLRQTPASPTSLPLTLQGALTFGDLVKARLLVMMGTVVGNCPPFNPQNL